MQPRVQAQAQAKQDGVAADTPRVGYNAVEWSRAVGICRAQTYKLLADEDVNIRPLSVTIGRRRILIERPRDYLDRIAAQQAHTSANEGINKR